MRHIRYFKNKNKTNHYPQKLLFDKMVEFSKKYTENYTIYEDNFKISNLNKFYDFSVYKNRIKIFVIEFDTRGKIKIKCHTDTYKLLLKYLYDTLSSHIRFRSKRYLPYGSFFTTRSITTDQVEGVIFDDNDYEIFKETERFGL